MTGHDEERDPIGAGRLDREIAPRRDLWPDIARRIAHEDRRSAAATVPSGRIGLGVRLSDFFRIPSWGLVGATALLACLLGGTVVWSTMRPDDEARVADASRPETFAELVATLDALEHECARVQADVVQILATTDVGEEEGTREVLFTNLSIMETAVAQARAALIANPNDPHLADLTLSAYRERLTFLQGAARVPLGADSNS